MQATRIFHIEDDEDYRVLVKVALVTNGYQEPVAEFNNAIDALSALREAPEPPALILLDLNMPRMSGGDFIKEVKGDPALAQIPIVVFTTSSNPDDERFCEQYGVDMLTKPYTMTAIEEMVDWMIKEKIHLQ
jgi:CheY-like chemotaxis protein